MTVSDLLGAMTLGGGSGITKDSRLATVDPAFTGTGNPKVTFDGETTMSQKAYPYVGNVPGGGDRVVMEPIGDTWYILGALGGSTGFYRDIKLFSGGPPADVEDITANPFTAHTIVLPDPGWPYQIMAGAAGYWQAQSTSPTATQWNLLVTLDSATGPALSNQGLGNPNGIRQSQAGFHRGATVYTGQHTAYMIYVRAAGSGQLAVSSNNAMSGMFIWQIPA
jgi:hypothetical protein